MMFKKIWSALFLEEQPSIGLSFFRIPVALTVGFHVIPSFFHLDDNYFSTALKTINGTFFPAAVLDIVQKSSDSIVLAFVILFLLTWIFFLIGFLSQISCILMTACCYYFYALNDFQIGTLSWDILLVTLFLMCLTNYHGDYFSIDALRRKDPLAYRRRRPIFLQRLLQLQIAMTFFYTGLYKISLQGNWLIDNPIYYLVNYPVEGVTKGFLLKDWMALHPGFCYWIGIFIIVMEMSLPFLLFHPKTRRSAIYLGFIFHVILLLTLDVPSIFFFLFPAQLLLFIPSQSQLDWIDQRRARNAASPRYLVVYDGDCGFCCESIKKLKIMDLLNKCEYIDANSRDLSTLHSSLTKEMAASQMYLITPNQELLGGFFAFRRMAWIMPMMMPLIPLFYLPGADSIGSAVYRWIAKNRYLLHFNNTCQNNRCFRS